MNFEGVHGPSKPLPLIQFEDADSLERCKTMSDMDIGGFSTVNIDYVPKSTTEPAHAHFHGSISTDLPPDRPDVFRTGYAAWRTLDRGYTIFGKTVWDIDPYRFIALRVNSDGRKYFVNIQTESIVPTDIHQHRLYTRTPGQWETVLIPLNEFVRTNHGMVVEPQREMLRQKVRTIGLGSIDRVLGPFSLRVAGIWATNWADGEDQQQEYSWSLKENKKEFELDTDRMPEQRPPRV